jgi:glycosyltransferase involved in cell wall biosynthesis
VIIVSSKYRRDISRFWPPAKRKLVDIPVGANITPSPDLCDGLEQLRSTLSFGKEDIVACYFGVVRPGKGIETLLKAFRHVQVRSAKVKLLVVGHIQDESYYDRVVSPLIAQLKVPEDVIFTGSCPPELVSRYLALADLCVLPFDDGVTAKRGSFVCALQHGLPIITTKSEHPPVGLIDRHNAILVEPGDVEALADAIVELAENEDLRARLSSGALVLAKQFDWASIARQTWGVYVACHSGAGAQRRLW